MARLSVGEVMPPRKIKVEFYDDGGTKHTLSLEGSLSREKVLKVLDYVELMGRLPPGRQHQTAARNTTKFERLQSIACGFGEGIFSSQDVQQQYSARYGETISLSTVSTYLARLVDRGVLQRSGSVAAWSYVRKPSGVLSWNNILDK